MKPFLLLATRAEDAVADSEAEAMLRFGGLSPTEMVRVRLESAPLEELLPDLDLTAYAGGPDGWQSVHLLRSGGEEVADADPGGDRAGQGDRRCGRPGRAVPRSVLRHQHPRDCYLGGVLDRTYAEPISAVPITLTEAGCADPLLAGLPRTFTAFVGHKEALRALPPGAVLLAGSAGCPVQMFRLGQHQYATQFHPELDVPGIIVRIHAYRHAGYFHPDAVDQLIEEVQRGPGHLARTHPGQLRRPVRPALARCSARRAVNDTRPELVVVTGASTGIGRASAGHLAAAGFQVLAGVRTDSAATEVAGDRIEPVLVDITDADQIATLAERVRSDPARRPLRALINNAGTSVNAPVEGIPLPDWRRQFETNLFGHIAMIQALLPDLLAARGRVINISSIGGLIAGPTYGAYSGSKFAMEAMSDALRREVKPFGVEVVVVEPGAIATEIWRKGTATAAELWQGMTEEQQGRYASLLTAIRRQTGARTTRGIPPERVAKVIVDAVTARRPRTRYLVGHDAKLIAALVKVLPDRALDRMISGRR